MDEMLDNTMLFALLGEAGVSELRNKLIDIVIEEAREQLHESSNYIIDPDDIRELIMETLRETMEEEIESYRDELLEKIKITISTALKYGEDL